MDIVYAYKVFFRSFMNHINVSQTEAKINATQKLKEATESVFDRIKSATASVAENKNARNDQKIRLLIQTKKLTTCFRIANTHLAYLQSGHCRVLHPEDKRSINEFDYAQFDIIDSGLSESTVGNLYVVGKKDNMAIDNILILIEIFSTDNNRWCFINQCEANIIKLLTHTTKSTDQNGEEIIETYSPRDADIDYILGVIRKAKNESHDSMEFFKSVLKALLDVELCKDEEYHIDSMDYHEWAINYLKNNILILISIVDNYAIQEDLSLAIQNAEYYTDVGYRSTPENEKVAAKKLLYYIHECEKIHSCFHEYIYCE